MKKIMYVVFSFFLMAECHAEKVVSAVTLQEKNGIFFAPNEKQPFTGTVVGNYSNGQKEGEIELINGTLTSSIKWYENGQKKEELNCKDGMKNGKCVGTQSMVEWYENGQKKSELNGRDGFDFAEFDKLDDPNFKLETIKGSGNGITWYEDGQKKQEFYIKDGKINGTIWNEDNQKQMEVKITLKNGKIIRDVLFEKK